MSPGAVGIQTGALLVDAFRELNHRKLFWISMGINVLVIAAAACFGLNERGVTLLWWEFSTPSLAAAFPSVAEFYRQIFLDLGVGIWLSWAAVILGLVSTASIFPDFLAGGSVDLWFSRPISRVRLFLTKYLFALLFVALQVAVFAVGAFLVMGIRGGLWAPGIFLAIPLVTAMFSYLFAFSVLFGVLTRSAIAALLLTIAVWFGLFVFNAADSALLSVSTMTKLEIETTKRRLEIQEKRRVPNEERVAALRTNLASLEGIPERIDWWHGLVVRIKTFLPKTEETVALMQRNLVPMEDLRRRAEAAQAPLDEPTPEGAPTEAPGAADPPPDAASAEEGASVDPAASAAAPTANAAAEPVSEAGPAEAGAIAAERVESVRRSRSVAWVLGTSLLFEAVLLAIAAAFVARRDY
ncbi:MAG TPA: ABC transporter permease [Phycisphaerales bacterium]|nr:ABC transporter permease [Phycisphaerales bacterium]HMP35979.1 ABC transporter permease [Phycisphaerales bacterium]